MSHLAPRIAGLLDRPARCSGLLTLGEEELVRAAAGEASGEASAWLDGFDGRIARERLATSACQAVCRHAGEYPAALEELTDPPAVLYVTGGLARLRELLEAPVDTIVGARRASHYALEVARGLGRGLAAAGVTVVSGLALGVDAAAHRGALDGGGLPLAVLAGGPDVPYPRINRELHARVVERGVAVAELPPGRRPFRWSFPARNRIMAGLASISVIVEAADRSGSLITAAFAEELGRDVAVVPGRVTASGAEGSNRLLREGATPIRHAADVLDELFGVGAGTASAGQARLGGVEALRATPEPQGLERPLRLVLEALEHGEGVDGMARAAGLSAAETRSALGRLELLGLVSRDDLGAYERRAG